MPESEARYEYKQAEVARKRGGKPVKLTKEEAPGTFERVLKDPLGWLDEAGDIPSRHAR